MAEQEEKVIQYTSHQRRALAILVDLLIWAALLSLLISTVQSGDEERIAAVVINAFSAWVLIIGIYGYLILQRGRRSESGYFVPWCAAWMAVARSSSPVKGMQIH